MPRFTRLTTLLSAVFLGGAIFVSGCSTTANLGLAKNGTGLQFNANELARYKASQDEIYQQLLGLAGLQSDPVNIYQWRQFISAGIHYSDQKCSNYINSLFWLDRWRKSSSKQIFTTGTYANSVLAIVESAAKDIALTAETFGLVGALYGEVNGNILYEVEPAIIKDLVEDKQAIYKRNLNLNFANRISSFEAIQGYTKLCLPSAIETDIANALKLSLRPRIPPPPTNRVVIPAKPVEESISEVPAQ
ncbi:MAG: Unknown protein [uncultured Thiotrichaceae bacterium]|uniref:Lipoprotein n=1 Tax=uncultured Thiotrichaceae bacterium TaxID=298394 RepID=A0A6S6UAC5_9GAMM|nr:MAG: Unknown protein [uncultured Thiotrichaceae bacterium]